MEMGPGNMAPVRIDLHTLVRYWLVSPFTCLMLATLLLAAFWYFQATRDAAEQGNPWPMRLAAAFWAGLVAIELAFQSSVAMLAYISFPMQVVQKVLLLVVAPPLLVLGAPLVLALETSSERTRDRIRSVVHSAPLRTLTHPVALFFLYFVGVLAYYLTSAVASSMRHVWFLNVVNLGFLVVALLFWWVVLGGEPAPRPSVSAGAKLALIGAGALVQAGLGMAILATSTPVAPIYTLPGSHQGGAILLVCLLLLSAAAALRLFPEWQRDQGTLDEDIEEEPAEAGEAAAPLWTSPPG
jgi:cytochrome c oxidase assembly factor CtaG